MVRFRALPEMPQSYHSLVAGQVIPHLDEMEKRGQNLTNAFLLQDTLTNANFTGATVAGAFFEYTLTASQLYSTASYQMQNLMHEADPLSSVPHGPGDLREAGAVHGLQAGVLHEDGELLSPGAEVRALHGHALRSGRGLQAGSGDGLLPGTLLPAELLRSGLLLPRDSAMPRMGPRDPGAGSLLHEVRA